MSTKVPRRSMSFRSSISVRSCRSDIQRSREDCIKLLKELSKYTAHYEMLMIALGTTCDNDSLRKELRRTQGRAYDLVLQNKARLMPYLRNNSAACTTISKEDLQEFERLWSIFMSCLESLESHLCKTVMLQKAFPLHQGNLVELIATGLLEGNVGQNKKQISYIERTDTAADKKVSEKEDLDILERDVLDFREVLNECSQLVDHKPWTVEPDLETVETLYRSCSGSDGSSVGGGASDTELSSQSRRKCICLTTVVLACAIVFVTILGVCVALLGHDTSGST
ncbi:regulator of G-protein signaling 9-binding protein [Lingula anatina]|uniref:Regulator of G-protein signaling 9-binding protein n=1 Tax=Lingula anatina TaxID=7574 RepID=A0A1S3J9J2_LINAN|nr:regulator of G-protein signaling 9-binding protein [Lingula anatina]|eukprot:XP_013406539.1 regulator of G-protein signaling 9-binding protein [Lingula anatina]